MTPEFHKDEPTPIGIKKYPDTGGYYKGIACVCAPCCTEICLGKYFEKCGCEACYVSFSEGGEHECEV